MIDRIKNEPAAVIGLAVTIVVLIVNFATGSDWDANTILTTLAPLLAGFGIRPVVRPAANSIPKPQTWDKR